MVLITYNLTPHNIDICNEENDKIATIKPSGLIVRAQMEESVWRTLGSSKVPVWEIQIMSDDESTNIMWDWVWEGVRLINVVTPHKSQFNRVTNERYGALGFALQGQVGR